MQVHSSPGGQMVVFDATSAADRAAISATMSRLAGKTPLSDARDEVARCEFQLADHVRMDEGAARMGYSRRSFVPQLEAKLADARARLAQLEMAK